MRTFEAHWLGRVRYDAAHALQERVLALRIAQAIPDTLLLLEHDPVVTLGRSARDGHVLLPRPVLAERGIAVHDTGRGGDVTYHGPGQLVAYPIFDLGPDRRDVRKYVRDLARVMIALGQDFGLDASFIEGDPALVGVWVDRKSPHHFPGDPRLPGGASQPAKIGAIGVRISRWVTMHGFAFNLTTDLSAYDVIVPCGIRQYGVTSVADLGVDALSVEQAATLSVAHFERAFEANGRLAKPAETAAFLARHDS